MRSPVGLGPNSFFLGGAGCADSSLQHTWDFSSLTRDHTFIPCFGRRILNHWTTKEVPPGAQLLRKRCSRAGSGVSEWGCEGAEASKPPSSPSLADSLYPLHGRACWQNRCRLLSPHSYHRTDREVQGLSERH